MLSRYCFIVDSLVAGERSSARHVVRILPESWPVRLVHV
jgi:hypothetical protein